MRVLTTDIFNGLTDRSKQDLKVVTHDGVFHADEVFAVALLIVLNRWENPIIVRTRDKTALAHAVEDQALYLIDAGGVYNPAMNNYDHHQEASLPSAFGLIFKAGNVEYKLYKSIETPDTDIKRRAVEKIAAFVQSIDDWDCNRNNAHTTAAALPDGWRVLPQIISAFNRPDRNAETQNSQFGLALTFATNVIENELHAETKAAIAEFEYDSRNVLTNGVAVFQKFSPVWKTKADHNFAVMPHPSGWQVVARDTAICTIPPAAAEFGGFIFRHVSGFMATFTDRESAVAFAITL